MIHAGRESGARRRGNFEFVFEGLAGIEDDGILKGDEVGPGKAVDLEDDRCRWLLRFADFRRKRVVDDCRLYPNDTSWCGRGRFEPARHGAWKAR